MYVFELDLMYAMSYPCHPLDPPMDRSLAPPLMLSWMMRVSLLHK
jgi:hypothetical protein